MYISKFYRLGAHAMKTPAARAAKAFAPAKYFMAHNQYLRTQRHGSFCTTAAKLDSEGEDEEPKSINVTFVNKNGEETHIKVPEGFSILEAAVDNDIDLEGACGGELSCSTCHVIVMDQKYYDKLPDPSDEEYDMLDLAFGLTKTSRLGCQIILTPELDGLRLALPSATRNISLGLL